VNEQSPEKKRRFLPIVIVGVILAALCGISLYLRIVLPYHDIFVNNQTVWFRETDAYYYMRNVESLVHNFPHFNMFDPYQLFPGGSGAVLRPFFAWIVAAAILLVKGAASIPYSAAALHGMEVVAAYVPAILGTLVLFPVYFIGKELFNRWAGVVSAALVVLIPSEFLHRSLLGFTDHHVAEVLFSTTAVLFLIMAIKRARERDISFTHILTRDWSTVGKPLIYTLLAGIFLGVYLLTWIGGLLFIFIIFACLVIQFIIDHLRRRSTDYLCIVGTPVFLIAFLMLLPLLRPGGLDTLYRFSMPFAIVVPIVLSVTSRLMAARALKPVYYPLGLLVVAGIGLAAFHAINPSLFRSVFNQFGVLTPSGAELTIMEVAPLSLAMGWSNFSTSFFIAFVALGMLVYVIVKGKSAEIVLLLVWSIIMLLAVHGQRRFAYYYTVNVALLTGYFFWKMLDLAGLNKLLTKSREVVKAVRKFKKKGKKSREQAKTGGFMQPRGVWARVIVVGIVLFAVVFLPIMPMAKALAGSPNAVMDAGWYNALLWLKDNSPDPFGDPDFYYALYPPQDEFKYPDTAYGVMSWWDYGHFIMQIAHRIPNANPGQAGAVQAGQFFTALNESSANEVADKEGTKYVVIDYMMTTSKFYAMAQWANKSESEFYQVYYAPYSSDALQLVALYYPAYYQSTVARLYNFDGKAVVPSGNSTVAASWAWKTGQELLNSGYKVIIYSQYNIVPINAAAQYNVIVGGQFFPSYEEAETYVSAQQPGNWEIGGVDPFKSIVPLEALSSYERVYPAQNITAITSTTVKIFKYLGSNQS
jgi:oligosaccharyl transferase (archaeosortase A-associated)